MENVDEVVQLNLSFYRDRAKFVIALIIAVLVAIALLIALSIVLYSEKPKPVYFIADQEWRMKPSVPIDQPYVSTADLLQWVNNVVSHAFVLDFVHYQDQLKTKTAYFTSDGWKVFLNQLNNTVNYNTVQNYKLFVRGHATGAPVILNQGLLAGRYAWWVQVPLRLDSVSYNRSYSQLLTMQFLIVRVPTLNNLDGVAIDNIIVTTTAGTR